MCINIIPMPKGQRKQIVFCSQHNFSLQPLRHGLHYKDTISVSFCKGKFEPKPKSKKAQPEQTCLSCPVFNKDKSHATSTFILQEEQKNFLENSEKFKQEHDGKIEDYNDEKSQMLIPKPKTRYSYCSVCRANYDDYLSHIKSEPHKANIGRSHFNRLILEHQKKYEAINIGRKIKPKNSETTQSTIPGFMQSDPQCEILGAPSKKYKRENLIHSPIPRMMVDPQIRNHHYPLQMNLPNFGQPQYPIMPPMQHMGQVPSMMPQMSYSYFMQNPWMYYYMMNQGFPNMGCHYPPVIDLEAQNP